MHPHVPQIAPPSYGFWVPDFHPHWDALVVMALLGGIYFFGVWWLRRDSPFYELRASQVTLFFLGLLTLLVASSWPVHDLSEGYLFSVHMVQHMIYTLILPPLLLLATPHWLLRPLLRPPGVAKAAAFLTHPIVAFIIFNAGQGATHIPAIVNLALYNHDFHLLVHIFLVVSALLMWWPVLSPLPELPRLPYPMQMMYLFLQSLVPTVIYAPLTFGGEVIYRFYDEAPRIWGLSALADQQLAGLIMKIGGGLILWAYITAIFFIWFNREEAGERDLEKGRPAQEILNPGAIVKEAEDFLKEEAKRGRHIEEGKGG